ncbi:hypothetical protein SGPA1_41245 [Streptomyces misionensis JCM 4497]
MRRPRVRRSWPRWGWRPGRHPPARPSVRFAGSCPSCRTLFRSCVPDWGSCLLSVVVDRSESSRVLAAKRPSVGLVDAWSATGFRSGSGGVGGRRGVRTGTPVRGRLRRKCAAVFGELLQRCLDHRRVPGHGETEGRSRATSSSPGGLLRERKWYSSGMSTGGPPGRGFAPSIELVSFWYDGCENADAQRSVRGRCPPVVRAHGRAVARGPARRCRPPR